MNTQPAIVTRGLTKDFGSGRGCSASISRSSRARCSGSLARTGGEIDHVAAAARSDRPKPGSARRLGLDSRKDSLAIRRWVGFLPGDPALYPKLTGRAVLDYLAHVRGGVDPRFRDSLWSGLTPIWTGRCTSS